MELVLGIDVGKKDLKVMPRFADAHLARGILIPNPLGIPDLIQLAKTFSIGRTLKLAMEPTGTYGDALRQAVADAGLQLYRVGCKASHDYAELYDGVPSQHDGKDAAVVAELCAIGKARPWPWKHPADWQRQMSVLVDEIDAQRNLHNAWCGRLEALLARHWPEALKVLKASSPTLLRILAEHGGPAPLAADPRARHKLCRYSAAKLDAGRIDLLLKCAASTIGVRQTPVEIERIKVLAERARAAHLAMDRGGRELAKLAENEPVILAMGKAVGVPTASVLWVMLGDPRLYECNQAYRKAMGLNLTEHSSGQQQGKLAISKRGSALVRRWMYLASLRLIRNHEPIRRWHAAKKARCLSAGMNTAKLATVGVMRKLAVALHAVAHGVAFDPGQLFPGGVRPAAELAMK